MCNAPVVGGNSVARHVLSADHRLGEISRPELVIPIFCSRKQTTLMPLRSKKITRDFLIDVSGQFWWHCVLIIPRTKENWMIAELDGHLSAASHQNMWTNMQRGRLYSYLVVDAEMEADALPDEIERTSNALRRACATTRSNLASVLGWCDFMSVREFARHDRRMAAECFGVGAVRETIRTTPGGICARNRQTPPVEKAHD
jgi:hypothetical protein